MIDKQLIQLAKKCGKYKECRDYAKMRLESRYRTNIPKILLDVETLHVISQYKEKGWL